MTDLTTEEKRPHNSTLAIGGVSSQLDSFVVAESSVLRTNFCAVKPAHRQSANRLTQDFGKGFSITNLQQMRQFYTVYSKQQTLSVNSEKDFIHSLDFKIIYFSILNFIVKRKLNTLFN